MEELEDMFEFHKQLENLFMKKFREQFPDAFIHCTTLDEQVYNTANQSMYSFYHLIVNKLAIWNHWNWRINSYYPNYLQQRHAMLQSLNNSDNVVMWAFENIKIS